MVKGGARKHSVVNYVFEHNPALLVAYHYIIMEEMERRGYHPDRTWDNPDWRGTLLQQQDGFANKVLVEELWTNVNQMSITIYPEHDENYYNECVKNLKEKGIEI